MTVAHHSTDDLPDPHDDLWPLFERAEAVKGTPLGIAAEGLRLALDDMLAMDFEDMSRTGRQARWSARVRLLLAHQAVLDASADL